MLWRCRITQDTCCHAFSRQSQRKSVSAVLKFLDLLQLIFEENILCLYFNSLVHNNSQAHVRGIFGPNQNFVDCVFNVFNLKRIGAWVPQMPSVRTLHEHSTYTSRTLHVDFTNTPRALHPYSWQWAYLELSDRLATAWLEAARHCRTIPLC